MKIYDISQEVFSCKVYPGDDSPKIIVNERMDNGSVYNLSSFSMCAHNGTHIDAPYHFYNEGKTIDDIDLYKVVGLAYVYEHHGDVLKTDAERIIEVAKIHNEEAMKRILIKGDVTITLEAAEILRNAGCVLVGNESQSVGPINAPMAVHKVLLGAEIVLLEGICLDEVNEGVYFLNAVPLSLAGFDGAPCRAILIDMK